MKRVMHSLISTVIVVTICIGLASSGVHGSCRCDNASASTTAQPGLMRPDEDTVKRWLDECDSLPQTSLNPHITELLLSSSYDSWDLLPLLDYVPNERDQGMCGNCWTWAGTGVLEVALNIEEGIKDRLSIQLFNSLWPGTIGSDWACCGGILSYFAEWYEDTGIAIPWDNPGGSWYDESSTCDDGESIIPPSVITLEPYYPIGQCEPENVPTHEVGQAAAISAIKNVLHQNKAVQFSFYMPNLAHQLDFINFWNWSTEEQLWHPDSYCGQPWVSGAGHAVVCVGYDETNPEEPYWIMLNSWGTTPDRPQGLFRVAMDMDYDCTFTVGTEHEYSFLWQTLAVEFDFPAPQLEHVIAYPNPFDKSRGHSDVVFTGLTTEATISIYTVSGELVRRFSNPDRLSWHWDMRNELGEDVSRGTYLYVVTTPSGESCTGRFAITQN